MIEMAAQSVFFRLKRSSGSLSTEAHEGDPTVPPPLATNFVNLDLSIQQLRLSFVRRHESCSVT